MTKTAAAESSSSKPGTGASPPGYLDCPVERDVLGQHTWTLLHTLAAHIPDNPSRREQRELSQFVTTLSKFYPCQWCSDELKNQCVSKQQQSVADPCRICNGGQGRAPQARVSRRRRRQGSGVWGGGFPLPTGGGSGEGQCPLPINFFDFKSKNVDF